MAEFETVSSASETAPGEMRLVNLGGREVVIANVDGAYCAFAHRCTHKFGPLAEGTLDGDTVTCPWHGARFNVRTGEPLEGGPAALPVATYEVRVEGDDVRLRKA